MFRVAVQVVRGTPSSSAARRVRFPEPPPQFVEGWRSGLTRPIYNGVSASTLALRGFESRPLLAFAGADGC